MPSYDCLAGASPRRVLQMQQQSGALVSCGRCGGCKRRQKLAEWASRGADWEFRHQEWTTVPWWTNGILACAFFFLVAVIGMCVLNFRTVRFARGSSSSAVEVIPGTETPTTAVLGSEVSLPDHTPIYISESVGAHVHVSDHGSTHPSESAEAPNPVLDHEWACPSGLAGEPSEEIKRFASSFWAEKLDSLAAAEAKTTSEDKTTSKDKTTPRAKTTSEETSLEAEQPTPEAKPTGESASPTADSTSSEAKLSMSNVTKHLRRGLATFTFSVGPNRHAL